ncbi:hypothetical protein ACTXT7_003803 [Hymenolepis weldensis]
MYEDADDESGRSMPVILSSPSQKKNSIQVSADAIVANAAELVKQFTDSLESAADLPLLTEYKSVVTKALVKVGANWKEQFRQAKTDFERVCFLLKAIESANGQHKRGVDKLGLPTTKEEILLVNGKSDGISRRYLSYGKLAIGEGDKETSLTAVTKAVFYAVSSEQLSRALALRCRLLHHLKLFDEAIEDGLKALSLSCSIPETGNVHLNLAHSYLIKNMLSESVSHYIQALTAFVENNIERNLENGLRAVKGLDECLSAMVENKSLLCEPSWKCFRSQAPDVKEIEMKMSPKKSKFNEDVSSNGIDSKFLSSPNCVVRLKHTGCTKSGWTMELNQDVSTDIDMQALKP